MTDSFKAKTTLDVGKQKYEIYGLAALKSQGVDRLPFSLKILLENLLRFEDGVNVKRSDIEALLAWDPKAAPHHEIAFTPAWQEQRGEDYLPTGHRIAPLPGPWDDCFGMPDGVDVTLTWPGVLELMITSPLRWVVVYDLPPDTVCVEPQSGPPNGLNTDPAVVAPGAPLAAEMSWSWRGLA